ncbi:TRAP transporter small permease [Flaviflagellibacter deserti]|uniref:TRAP transporter small permease protein n=1 Tax=Flaviflagellibacter deserti TaxID=2267266 RepID=A0ABV9YWC2_9HYPH
MMDSIAAKLARIVEWTMGILLAIMVVLIFTNAAGRYLFSAGFASAEELGRLAFVWLIFLGAILAVRERSHVGIDMLVQRFGPTGKRISLGAMNLLILYALWLFGKGSWQQTIIGMQSHTPVTGIPLAVYAVAGLVCAVAMTALFIIDLFRLVTGRVRDDELIQVRETPNHDDVLLATNGKAHVVHAPTENPQK